MTYLEYAAGAKRCLRCEKLYLLISMPVVPTLSAFNFSGCDTPACVRASSKPMVFGYRPPPECYPCRHCERPLQSHAAGFCVFSPTRFSPLTLEELYAIQSAWVDQKVSLKRMLFAVRPRDFIAHRRDLAPQATLDSPVLKQKEKEEA